MYLSGMRWHFNPRSPHGERLVYADALMAFDIISIHAPRTGSDTLYRYLMLAYIISIHAPRTGSDVHDKSTDFGNIISIHAPRTGSDFLE